jgi:hypothetical protein
MLQGVNKIRPKAIKVRLNVLKTLIQIWQDYKYHRLANASQGICCWACFLWEKVGARAN